jgi:hypothetical protein
MKKIFKLGINSALLAVFLSMLILPMAFMGTAKFEEKPSVLSAQDSNEEKTYEASEIKAIDDPEANVPEDIKEMILKMEREYYESQKQSFVEDIERDEKNEVTNIPEDLDIKEGSTEPTE